LLILVSQKVQFVPFLSITATKGNQSPTANWPTKGNQSPTTNRPTKGEQSPTTNRPTKGDQLFLASFSTIEILSILSPLTKIIEWLSFIII
jgi:hypothetical protein